MERFDVVVVGGGIVGLASAYGLVKRHPGLRVVVLEKESEVAQHQSGRNSGVLHSGIYYQPGSLKARLCLEGKRSMEAFCESEGIPFERCGKVIVAVGEQERPALRRLYKRGLQNGVRCKLINTGELSSLEPHVAGVEAIHVVETGVVDFKQVCTRLVAILEKQSEGVLTGLRVQQIEAKPEAIVLNTDSRSLECRYLVNCGGLYADRLAAMTGSPPIWILPFRGEYFRLRESAEHLCRGLIYPVPDPRFPFLGVHFTRRVHGGVDCGPNAVLAWGREAYLNSQFSGRDVLEMFGTMAFWRITGKYWRFGLSEYRRSLSRKRFTQALQRLVPEVGEEDLLPAPSGIRAQAVTRDGRFVDDFLIQMEGRIVQVCNAPSPAATSSLKIGETVSTRLSACLT